MRLGLLALVIYMLGACPGLLAETRRDILVATDSPTEVRERLIKVLLDDGFMLKTETTSILTFTKKLTGVRGVLHQAVLGSPNSTAPEFELTCNIVQTSSATRLAISAAVVMQNAFGQVQRNTELPKQDGAYLENMLSNIKAAVEGTVVNPDEPHGVNAQKPFFAIAGSELLERKLTQPEIIRGSAAWDVRRSSKGAAAIIVGLFYDSDKPRDPKSLEERILSHAAELGADLVVILPSAKDVRAIAPDQSLSIKFGAIALANTKARLGVVWDKKLFQKGRFVVSQIIPEATETARDIKVGDEVLEIDNIPITDTRIQILAVRRKPGDQVKIGVLRNGVREEVVIEAIAQP